MSQNKGLLNQALECVKKSPLRMTRKRERLLQALVTSDRPISAAELRDRAKLPESDLVTVYRTLEAFEGIRIIQKIPLEAGGHLFELTAPHDHHHHFVCRQCHKAERLDICFAKELEKHASRLGYHDIKHVLEVYGLCKLCYSENASAD